MTMMMTMMMLKLKFIHSPIRYHFLSDHTNTCILIFKFKIHHFIFQLACTYVCTRFEVNSAVFLKFNSFWVSSMCFLGLFSPLKMDTLLTFEKSRATRLTTRHHITETLNFKPYMFHPKFSNSIRRITSLINISDL